MMKRRGGYTILEVLVAVIILAITLPGLTVLVVGSRKTQVDSKRLETAAAFGQQVYDSLCLLPPGMPAATGSSTITIDQQTYTASWNKTVLMSAGGAPTPLGGSTVVLTVGWNVGGKAHTSVLNGVLP